MGKRYAYLWAMAAIFMLASGGASRADERSIRYCLDLREIQSEAVADTLRSSLNPPVLVPLNEDVDPSDSATSWFNVELQEKGLLLLRTAALREKQTWKSISTERNRLVTLLNNDGYLDAKITVYPHSRGLMEEGFYCPPSGNDRHANQIFAFRPEPGPLYRIGWIHVSSVEGSDPTAIRTDLQWILVRSMGKQAQGRALIQAEEEVLWHVRSASFPYAKIVERKLVRAANQTAGLHVVVDPGPKKHFGAVEWRGAIKIDRELLNRYVPFSQGDPFSQEKIHSLRKSLEATGLFTTVHIDLRDAPGSPDNLNVAVRLQAKPPSPERLAREGATGQTAMMAALAVLGGRQVLLAGSRKPRARKFFLLNMLTLLMLALSAVFATSRLLDLMG